MVVSLSVLWLLYSSAAWIGEEDAISRAGLRFYDVNTPPMAGRIAHQHSALGAARALHLQCCQSTAQYFTVLLSFTKKCHEVPHGLQGRKRYWLR